MTAPAAPLLRRVFGGRAMRRLHGWIGFNLCLVLGFLCLSGTLTTIGHELDWLADPGLRVIPSGHRASFGQMAEAVRSERPGWTLQRLTAPIGPRFAAEARATTPGGEQRLLHVDPYRARVAGESSRETVHATLRQIHRQFYLPTVGGINIGVYASTPFALALFLMLVSGLVIYPRFWRGLFRLRLGQGRGPLLGDLHRLVAGWSLWFLAAMSATGMWYFAERALLDAGVRLDDPPPRATTAPGKYLPLDELVALAQAAYPGFRITAVYFPRRPGEAMRFDGQAGDLLVRDRANRVYLDPGSGTVLRIDRIAEQGALRRWNETANPLHFGDFAGLPSRIVWFVFGLGLTTLVFTGAWIYLRRLRNERALARRGLRQAAE